MNKALVIILISPILAFAQRTENAINFSPNNNNIVFELHNDMLFSTDSYYTAGLSLGYSSKKFKKTLAQLILKPRNKGVVNFAGFNIEQRIFTPSSIVEPLSIPNDQPYSAFLLLTNYSVNVNAEKKMKIFNEIGIGLMGPYAFGEEMQTLVHEIVNVESPIGWENQLRSTLLLDYQGRIERGFGPDWLANHIVPFFGARVGTLTNRVFIGTMVKFGNKDKYLKQSIDLELARKKIIWEWVFSANLQGVFYDATLQGDFFNSDPNSLDKSETNSHQYQIRTGVNLYYQNFSLRYMLNFNSATFNEAVFHRYGGINVGYSF